MTDADGRLGDAAPATADQVAAVVLAVPGVAGLHRGSYGEIGTYLPGRRVDGIRLGQDTAEVHIAVTMDAHVPTVGEQVRAAVGTVIDGAVDVVVEDVLPAAPAER